MERVGLYIPGGHGKLSFNRAYERHTREIAGVKEVIIAARHPKTERLTPIVLAAAKIAGRGRSIQDRRGEAIAALAYGTESVPKVDKITGPGNIFVAAAKSLCSARLA